MSKGTHRSPAQWRSISREFDSSALSTNDFCKRKQISSQSLYRWRKLLESESAPEQTLFAPIQPVPEAVRGSVTADGHCNFRLALGRWLTFELSIPLS